MSKQPSAKRQPGAKGRPAVSVPRFAPFYGLLAFVNQQPEAHRKKPSRVLNLTIVLGLTSAFLYVGLYRIQDQLVRFAGLTHSAHKLYLLIPIGIGLVFLFVHDALTGHLSDLLGLKPKPKL